MIKEILHKEIQEVKSALVAETKEDLVRKSVVGSATQHKLLFFRYLSIAGEGGVVKQEVGTKKHHNSIVDTQDGPVDEDGPSQQRVLCNVSEAEEQRKCGVTFERLVERDFGRVSTLIDGSALVCGHFWRTLNHKPLQWDTLIRFGHCVQIFRISRGDQSNTARDFPGTVG